MTQLLAGLFLSVALLGSASANDDLGRVVAERAGAAGCWVSASSLRGIRFDAVFSFGVSAGGKVKVVEIVDVQPDNDTIRSIAVDLADRVKNCRPNPAEGIGATSVRISWPM